ncbi:MAG TPA: hypothetical protein DDY54_10125 [Deltaproteobacteria bacterium]|nr:hypothetical protein [Deltaproteobacteria bacterium]
MINRFLKNTLLLFLPALLDLQTLTKVGGGFVRLNSGHFSLHFIGSLHWDCTILLPASALPDFLVETKHSGARIVSTAISLIIIADSSGACKSIL